MTISPRTFITALTLGWILAVTACSSPVDEPAASTADDVPSSAAESVTVSDAWVKTSESEMTPAFGLLTNAGFEDVTVVSVSTAAATMAELHETVEDESGTMVMRPIEGGFVIPAGASFPLEPAANHLMLMELAAPLSPGQTVEFTLEFSDGSTLDFASVVKDYAGANENYVPAEDDETSGE